MKADSRKWMMTKRQDLERLKGGLGGDTFPPGFNQNDDGSSY